MLTRLKVSGFKNLVDLDVSFGPFTCIAGPNGVGKSNLIDAIRFLGASADRPLVDAALSIRGTGSRAEDISSLFQRTGSRGKDRISFEAELLVPTSGIGDLAEAATASATFLRYRLDIGRRDDAALTGPLELLTEELATIPADVATTRLQFPEISPQWLQSVLRSDGKPHTFITTERGSVVSHGEPGMAGAPKVSPITALSRTVLSAAQADDSPTVFLARSELRSWLCLQLEPSALRRPDEGWGASMLGPDGSHLPGTLYHLALAGSFFAQGKRARTSAEARVYAEVAGRLKMLVDDVQSVTVVRDDERQLLTLYVTDGDGTRYPARSLSDGSLRFLALAVLSLQPEADNRHGFTLLCLEEPENGVSPDRIPALIGLLRFIATDAGLPAGRDNPLRQVIITTHSPAIVVQVPEDSLLIAERHLLLTEHGRGQGAAFSALPGSWREAMPGAGKPAPLGALLAYLNPIQPDGDTDGNLTRTGMLPERRIADRDDLRRLGIVAPRKG